MEQLQGSVENIIFQSDDKRYCVLRIKDTSGAMVTAVYRGPAPFLGETVKASGDWVRHPRFGQQFSITGYQSVKPGSAEGIERFLSSGAVKGIGKAMASRIVAHFGKQTLEVLGSDPSRLMEVSGIGVKKAEAIGKAYSEISDLREIMLFLEENGVSGSYAAKLQLAYGDTAVTRIKANPYRLISDIEGIGFKTADRIALSLGFEPASEERVRAGVEVRVFYDDMGSIGFINTDFVKRMEGKGIRCRVFNPFAPGLKVFLNNRDHRKITVVDGKVGFTGGYNLANEYFHVTEPFGFWKDTGIKLTGDAVKSLTVTFLEMWNAVKDGDRDDADFDQYLPDNPYHAQQTGFIQPYADSPMDEEQVGEEVYISVAESAENYVWFITPYLIITDEMTHALSLAAKRGVDVRIITPGIPDKKMVYSMTRSFYGGLVRNGVRIFEYTPGFCHCKMSVSDDRVATCGTINLDYRSLYHHFENGCLYYDCQAVLDTKRDFESTFAQCKEVTEDYRTGHGQFLRLKQLVLRLIAPLL